MLAEGKDEVSFRRIGGNKLFMLGEINVLFEEFIESIVFATDELYMDVYDLKELLQKRYGITVTTHKIVETTRNTGLFYDTISEKIYADYDIYYEEV